MQRAVLVVRKRVQGAEHPDTLTTANDLASSLFDLGKHAEVEAMRRAVLAVLKCVLGAEHPNTLADASDMQQYLSRQGKHAEEEGLKGARGTKGQAGATEEEAAKSEVQDTRKRAAEGSRAFADASKWRKQ